MPRTLIKSRLHSGKRLPIIKQEMYNTNSSSLPPNIRIFKQKLLSGSGFVIYK